jgi:hypothetical protein
VDRQLGRLGKRGWTDALVKRFLGEPDKTAPNPVYSSKAPMRLYAVARVVGIEESPEWAAAREAGRPRVEAAKRVAAERAAAALAEFEARRDRFLARLEAHVVHVSRLDPERLLHSAIDHYNNGRDLDDDRTADAASDSAFLARVQVNFLRHHWSTGYDRLLEVVDRERAGLEVAAAVRRKVYQAIADAYPELAAECARQERRREGHIAMALAYLSERSRGQ